MACRLPLRRVLLHLESPYIPPPCVLSPSHPMSPPSPPPPAEKTRSKSELNVDTDAVPAPAGPTFPEGGLRAWLTVAGGSMVVFCTFGAVQSFGVYQDYYTRISLNEHTASEVSWIGSFQVFMLFALGLPVGKLFDEGYFRETVVVGALIYLFSLFMLSLTQPHQYYQTFLAQGVGMGLGMGILFIPALSVTSHYFQRRRSLAMGCVIAGSSLGGVVWPIMLNHLLNERAGFRWAVRASGFIALGLLFAAVLFMKTRLPGRRDRPNAKPVSIRTVLTDVPYLICIIGGFFVYWVFYLQLFANLHGVPRNIVHYTIPILNASSLFGRTLPNIAADRYGRFNVAIPLTVTTGLLIFAMFGATNVHGLLGFAIVYGFFSGAWMSLTAPVVSLFATSVDEVGLRLGCGMFLFSFALLTGNPISGALLESPRYLWGRPIVFNAVRIVPSFRWSVGVRADILVAMATGHDPVRLRATIGDVLLVPSYSGPYPKTTDGQEPARGIFAVECNGNKSIVLRAAHSICSCRKSVQIVRVERWISIQTAQKLREDVGSRIPGAASWS
ncbi:hypothetical protein EVG20_g10333, partial [Dentipellis fragilis]